MTDHGRVDATTDAVPTGHYDDLDALIEAIVEAIAAKIRPDRADQVDWQDTFEADPAA
jgi:hypothetical protein